MRLPILSAALIWSGAAAACTTEIDLTATLETRRVSAQRAQFHRTLEAPPPGTPSPTRGPFVVAGDLVVVSQTRGAFACAHYVDSRGRPTSGWLPSTRLSAVLEPGEADWAGRWRSGPEQTITITTVESGIEIEGTASYGATNPERAARGAINTGDIGAVVRPSGATAGFTISTRDQRILPYEDGEPRDCRVRLMRRGPYLVVWDNLACGGYNVTFRGVYRR